MGDDNKVEVGTISHFRLLLRTSYIDLKETYVVPSFKWNLISDSVLDKSRYSCLRGNGKFSFFQDFNFIGTNSLINNDNLYLLDTIAPDIEILHSTSRGTK